MGKCCYVKIQEKGKQIKKIETESIVKIDFLLRWRRLAQQISLVTVAGKFDLLPTIVRFRQWVYNINNSIHLFRDMRDVNIGYNCTYLERCDVECSDLMLMIRGCTKD